MTVVDQAADCRGDELATGQRLVELLQGLAGRRVAGEEPLDVRRRRRVGLEALDRGDPGQGERLVGEAAGRKQALIPGQRRPERARLLVALGSEQNKRSLCRRRQTKRDARLRRRRRFGRPVERAERATAIEVCVGDRRPAAQEVEIILVERLLPELEGGVAAGEEIMAGQVAARRRRHEELQDGAGLLRLVAREHKPRRAEQRLAAQLGRPAVAVAT